MEKAVETKLMHVTNYEYDSYNRVTKSIRTDANNKLLKSNDYFYNNDGLLLYEIKSTTGIPRVMTTFAYNDDKQLKMETVNIIGIPNKALRYDAPIFLRSDKS